MFLSRLKNHMTEQNWFAVWLELFILFLAVFVGLQADNWNEERIAKKNAKIYYERLITDLESEERTRLTRIKYNEQVLAHGKSALEALQQPELKNKEEFLIDLYQATQLWNYTPQRATYDELLSVGIANAIPNIEARTRLANYYLGLQNSQQIQQERIPYRQSLRRFMPHVIQSAVRQNCGDIFESGEDGVVLIYLPEECSLSLDQAVIDSAIDKTLLYENLEVDLTQRLADLENKVTNLRNYITPTRELASQLAELTD